MTVDAFFQKHKSVAVAFSGGVDSAVLLLYAKRYADRVKAYFVKSSFQPDFELNDALAVADLLETEIAVLFVDILSDVNVADNPKNRCYYCKKRIFGAICNAAQKDGFETVIEGTNASDDIADRPGFEAIREMGILSPLREFGYTKEQIRAIATENRLPVADKPSYACLATRIPSGTHITEQLLSKTQEAEEMLRQEGFKNFRIRYARGDAKLELGKADFELFGKKRDRVVSLLTPYYENLFLDLKERTDE